MGRRSYTPSPPPPPSRGRYGGGYGRRGRSPSPRGRYGSRPTDLPTSLLVRNLPLNCRPEDLQRPFGQFGPLKDIYLPRDYYSGEEVKVLKTPRQDIKAREPRGFGFVQFVDPNDAAEAKHQMDGEILLGRQMTVVFAEENRKKPSDMRIRERRSGSRFSYRRRSPPRRYSRSPRYVRSPPPRYARSPSGSRDYSPSPRRRQYSRSISPRDRRYSRERSYSRTPVRDRSPSYDRPARSPSRSLREERSPPYDGSRSRSRGPVRSPSCSRSRSRSGEPGGYYVSPPRRDASRSP